jgi:hypothetical protein
MLSVNINGLAVLAHTSDNGFHEAQRCERLPKRSDSEEAHGTSGRLFVAISRRGAGAQNSQLRKSYFRREEEKERQSRTASSSLSGSSSSCSPRIAWRNSISVSRSSASLTCRNNSAFSFLAFKSSGRLPRLFSSAITSRMSSSKGLSGMWKTLNSGGFYTPQLPVSLLQSCVASSAPRLTIQNRPVYTVPSRWTRFCAPACLESFRAQPTVLQRAAGISEISNLGEPPAARP